MALHWDDIRYRGDAKDVEELLNVYRVQDYLDTFAENRKQADQGMRERFLTHGIRLTEQLSPRIFGIFQDACQRLELATEAEVFCVPDPAVNAFASLDQRRDRSHSLVGITSGALEMLTDDELRSLIGHELGHFIFGNNRLNALLSTEEHGHSATVLPAFGEALFLRWRKKAEISADRVGLIACRRFSSAASGLLKATFGLSDRNLNLDVEALIAQFDEIKGRPELMAESFASHPLLPIRLKALELFSRSAKGHRAGLNVSGTQLLDDELEDEVDALLQLTRRHPTKPIDQAVVKTIALGGALLLGADGDVSDEEVKILIRILHDFTDEPEREVVTDATAIADQLPQATAVVVAEGDDSHKTFILSRLADIALADGALLDHEGAVVLQVAEMLGVPPRAAYSIMVGAAQAVGFRTDVKLNRIADDLRHSLQRGFDPLHRAQP